MNIYTLTSELHDERSVEALTHEFLSSLGIGYEFRGSDFTAYGQNGLDVIYVRTGGTEGLFRRLLPQLRQQSSAPFRLLASSQSNSLAASLEILSFLRQHGLKGEIIHGSQQYVASRLQLLEQAEKARRTLQGTRLGIIGQPSDWLIASHADVEAVKSRLGITLVDIPMQELNDALPADHDIYTALRTVVSRHQLQGFTLRCFDLLTSLHDTGCMALARLNAEGFVAGCEGDVPAMLTMMVTRALTGVSGFQANPASIDMERGELLFAHCTIPLDMVERYELMTHFESGIGTGIRGFMRLGPVTIFKLAGDVSRHFAAEGQLKENLSRPNLCRTQQLVSLDDPQQAAYFLNDPIGNHHIIMPGHQRALIGELLSSF